MLDPSFIHQATAVWWQGDFVLVDEIPEALQFDMLALVDKGEQEDPEEVPFVWSPTAVLGFVLVTQTCDVARYWNGKTERKWVLVAPLVRPPKEQWTNILKGKVPRFHLMEAIRERGLAMDLERIQTLSKAALAGISEFRHPGCKTQEERRDLAQVLSDKFSRPALPDDFTGSEPGNEGAIAGLEGYLIQGLRGGGDLQEFLQATDEIRITPFGKEVFFPWDSPEVEVLFFFVLRKREIADLDLERWEACAKEIVGRMKTTGRFRLCGSGYPMLKNAEVFGISGSRVSNAVNNPIPLMVYWILAQFSGHF